MTLKHTMHVLLIAKSTGEVKYTGYIYIQKYIHSLSLDMLNLNLTGSQHDKSLNIEIYECVEVTLQHPNCVAFLVIMLVATPQVGCKRIQT